MRIFSPSFLVIPDAPTLLSEQDEDDLAGCDQIVASVSSASVAGVTGPMTTQLYQPRPHWPEDKESNLASRWAFAAMPQEQQYFFICHACGQSFCRPFDQDGTGETLRCVSCGSEFVEMLDSLMDFFPTLRRLQALATAGEEEEEEREEEGEELGTSQFARRATTEPDSEELIYDTPFTNFILAGEGADEGEESHLVFRMPPSAGEEELGQQEPDWDYEEGSRYGGGGGARLPPTLFAHRRDPALSLLDMIRLMVRPDALPRSHPIWGSLGFHGDPGDYVVGEAAFQNLLQRLMDQSGHQSTVGLSEEQLGELSREKVSFSESPSDADSVECAICQEGYRQGEERVQLACRHRFHNHCIIPWLERVASCPVCRHDPLQP